MPQRFSIHWLGTTHAMNTSRLEGPKSRLALVDGLPAVDAKALHALTRGNSRLAQELLDMLLAELPVHRAKIHETFHLGDLGTLAVLAHTLRGAAAYCAATALQSASHDVETAAHERDDDSLAEALVVLWQQVERLLAYRSNAAQF